MKEQLEELNVRVVVIGFEDGDRLEWLRARIDSPFLFVRDPDGSAYRAYGLRRAAWARTYLHPDVVLGYARMLLKGQRPDLHLGQDRRQLGGDFVIDPEGRVVFGHRERGPEDRASVEHLIDVAARSIKANGPD